MSDTTENLQAAFSGESQANRRYLAFAGKAESEGYPQIARLFRAAAEAETVHAHNHLEVLGGIGTTEGNLETAIKGENYEFMKMYPAFIDQAKADNNQRALVVFQYANEVEKVHHDLYQEALKAIRAGQQLKEAPFFVCQVCGNTVVGDAPDTCPIYGAPRDKFKRVE
jgi:rubrerythrin